MSDTLQKILTGSPLSVADAEAAFDRFMKGDASPVEMAALLSALKVRGESSTEVAGGVRALRKAMIPLELDTDRLVDTCGTGGGTLATFNISTASSIVAAGAGVKIAKHGNRSYTSKCGSADVLEAAGVALELGPEHVAKCIEKVGIGFMFAPIYHPAMKHAIVPRRELKQRTIFNILGPITNPAGATRQLTGVYDAELTEPIAHVLGELGCKSAMVIHSHDGLDELTTSGPNRISHLRTDGTVHTFELEAKDLGIDSKHPESMTGGSIDKNLEMLRNILEGTSEGSQTDTVLLNACLLYTSPSPRDRG
mgnify:CR=1 FL=1